jgi:nucleoside-diphosphate-sugar epimerase
MLLADLDIEELDKCLARCSPVLESLSGARIFVTGGTGFFGRWVLGSLARASRRYDLQVVALTRDARGFQRTFPCLANHPAIRLWEGDVRTFEGPAEGFTHVIHAATDTSAMAARDSLTLADTIVRGSARVLEFARARGVRRMLYLSSGAVYGPQPPSVERIPEDFEGAPPALEAGSVYGQSKRLAEQLCLGEAREDFAPIIARAFAFVGPGLPLSGHFAIGNFIADAVAGRPILIKGSGETVRSYLYAGDLAAWLLTLLAHAPTCSVYNVGSDQAYALCDVAARVSANAPGRLPVRILGETGDGSRQRYVPAITSARGLGLDVWTSLDEAIRATIKHALRTGSASH